MLPLWRCALSLALRYSKKKYPQFSFQTASVFCWVSEKKIIRYNPDLLNVRVGMFQLLHELGHAICGHQVFGSGIELLKIETEAWEAAKKLGEEYNIAISQDHIEKCIDTYRDWLHLRSTCPNCSMVSSETAPTLYRCFNCSTQWSVPADQRRRCYRKKLLK